MNQTDSCFLKREIKTRSPCNDIFKVLKEKDKKQKCHAGIIYPVRLPFECVSEISIFQDKLKQRIHHQETCTERNAEGNSSDRRQVILETQGGMKNNRMKRGQI